METAHSVNPLMILPFGLLLGSIALMPLFAPAWWGKNYSKVSFGLGMITLLYYFGFLREFHRPLETFEEYVSFICLIGSLFVISGGIHINVRGESKPWINTVMLGLGAVLANLIGTTGASMVLIRPFLRANKYRLTSYHVIFFIFIVSNAGGVLTPIGDPPLYLGFLQGIPFFWVTQKLLGIWLVGIGWLLAMFYIYDRIHFLKAPRKVREMETAHETWKFQGFTNFIWIGVVLSSLFLPSIYFLREGVMLGAAFMAWKTTSPSIRETNNFSWAPIEEVAILFLGIFATMMPALEWLEINSRSLGISNPASFYWCSGSLSAVLDNAPTYLNFLSAAIGLHWTPELESSLRTALSQPGSHYGTDITQTLSLMKEYGLGSGSAEISTRVLQIFYLLANHAAYILAISAGSVFFGACTYIGNGPNFMVKSIADHAGAKTPTFFAYIFRFTIPVLLPMLALVWWLFFKNHP